MSGVDFGERAAAAAFAAEVGYYLEHHLDGRDAASLDDLRTRCAAVARAALGEDPPDVGQVREALLAAIRFSPYPDAPPALRALDDHGLRVVAVSNWDCSLPEVLRGAGLAAHLDAVVCSAVMGAAKPDPAVFAAALAAAGCAAEEVVHVGDSLETDVAGARAAGIEPVLIAREGATETPLGLRSIRTLAELPALVV